MRNVGLDETLAGIMFAGRNMKNLRYADDTTDMAHLLSMARGVKYEQINQQSSGESYKARVKIS